MQQSGLAPAEEHALFRNGSPALIRTWDDHIICWTPGATRTYGWTAEQAIGRKCCDLLSTVFLAPAATIEQELREAGCWTGEVRQTHRSGSGLIVQSTRTLVRDSAGQEYVVEVNIDVSAQALAREQSRNGEQPFEVCRKLAGLAIWDWHVDDANISHSEEWWLQHGRPPLPWGPSFQEWLSWIDVRDRDAVAEAVEKSLQTGAPYEIDFRVIWPDGSVHWLHARGRPYLDETGRAYRMIGANLDITPQKHLEERLRSINRSLTEANRELYQFSYALGHDIKEPLRAVRACSSLLSQRIRVFAEDHDALGYIGFIEQGVGRMQKMVETLLEYARSADRPLNFVAANAEVIARRAVENLAQAVEESHAEIEIAPLPEIQASPDILQQVFQNLIENAIKYRDGNRRAVISISCARQDHEWIFRIHDNGRGFDPKRSERIFQLFAREGDSNVAGLGIGLAVCRRIIARHGGRIWAESCPGDGSDFYFSIPVIPPDLNVASASTGGAARPTA